MSKTKLAVKPIETEEERLGLVDRLLELEKQLKELAAEKKEIEERLEAWALEHTEEHKPLEDAGREGRRVMLSGRRCRVPLVFTSDLIIGSFQDGSPKHRELLGILSGDEYTDPDARPALLEKFFKKPSKWEVRIDDGAKFRACVAEWLHPNTAPKFLAACKAVDKHGIAKSKTGFDFKAAQAIEEQPSK
jgi:hypothetical protein